MIHRPLWVAALGFGLSSAPAQAFMCAGFVEPPVFIEGAAPPTEAEALRHTSIEIYQSIKSFQRENDIMIVGTFSRNNAAPFLHEDQLPDIRSRLLARDGSVAMPYSIEYFYLDAYSFEGDQLMDGALVPFSDQSISATVLLSSEYGGIVGLLPYEDSPVIGLLQPTNNGRIYEITSWICPTYAALDAVQFLDLLACHAEEVCQ